MKCNLLDVSYGITRKYEIENNHMASDLNLMFSYLDTYRKELNQFIKNYKENDRFAHQMVWEARINAIENFKNKYKDFLDFINEIEQEENAL